MIPNPKLREIGRLLKEEESRFIGYPEIEAKSKDLGFGMTVSTLRFYVDEGILPPPKKVGKTPVYEEDWILNVLLSIHLMKTRLNRSLPDIRLVLQRLQEDPAFLADKLSVLYEDFVKGGSLKPVERDWLVEAFFSLLLGKFGRARNASEVRLLDLVRALGDLGKWTTPNIWEPPDPARVRLLLAEQENQGRPETRREGAPDPVPTGTVADAAPKEPEVRQARRGDTAEIPAPTLPDDDADASALPSPIPVPVPTTAATPAPEPLKGGANAVPIDRAHHLEEIFISRFEAAFEARTHVPSPLEGTVLRCGLAERSHLKRDHSSKVIDLMKRNRVYDRSLLDTIPLDEASEYHVYQRGFLGILGKGDLKVVIAALSLSPLETLVTRRTAEAPLGPADIERAMAELVVQDDIFYYVGILSTTGWTQEARSATLVRTNLLACLVELPPAADKAKPVPAPAKPKDLPFEQNPWARHYAPDPRWGGLDRLFDPETDREKVDRVRAYFLGHPELKLRGGHVILKNVRDDLLVLEDALRAAVAELCATDPDLSLLEVGGREILKRRRV